MIPISATERWLDEEPQYGLPDVQYSATSLTSEQNPRPQYSRASYAESRCG